MDGLWDRPALGIKLAIAGVVPDVVRDRSVVHRSPLVPIRAIDAVWPQRERLARVVEREPSEAGEADVEAVAAADEVVLLRADLVRRLRVEVSRSK